VRINGLEKTANDPDVHGKDVKVAGNCAPENGNTHRAKSEDHCLERRRVFSGQTEGSAVLVVKFVDFLVKERGMQSTVKPVVPCVFEDKEDGDLIGHRPDGGEGYRG